MATLLEILLYKFLCVFKQFIFCQNKFSYEIICADHGRVPLAMVQTMKKLKSGYINGTRVMLGHLGDFLNTSAITDLSFLGSQEDGYPDRNYFYDYMNRRTMRYYDVCFIPFMK